MIPSHVTIPVHVTAKEMVACFTLSVILSCSDFLNLLPHLPLPGDPDYLLAPWVPLAWAPSVVLAVLAAGHPGHAPLQLAPVEWLQHFQVLVVLAPGHLDCPTSTEVPRELISCTAHLWSTSLYSAEKHKKQMLHTIRAMDTLVVFSKLTHAVTSKLTQGALPFHTVAGSDAWLSFMWSCKACEVRKFSEQSGH